MIETLEGKELPGYELEYNALRSETIKRIELRQQLLALTLTISGVFLGLGINNSTIALVYPPLAVFLASAWLQNDLRILDLAVYNRDHLEKVIPGLCWETHMQQMRLAEMQHGRLRRTLLSHGGAFLFTQLIAVGIGLTQFSSSPVNWALLAISVVSILLVLLTFRNAQRESKQVKPSAR